MRCERCRCLIKPGGRGRIPTYCSTACRVAAHRARRAIPLELLAATRWVRHDDKRPITATGGAASSTDPRTWASYDEVKRSRVGDGLGFVLGAGFACLDLDHCLDEDGQPDRRARKILAQASSAYVEVSPSGTGLHVWGRAPERPGRRLPGFEVYSVGRYITVTGQVFRGGGLADLSMFFVGAELALR